MIWKPASDMPRNELEKEVRQLREALERILIDPSLADLVNHEGIQDAIYSQSTDALLSILLERRRAGPAIMAEEGRRRTDEMLARRRAEAPHSHDSESLKPDATDNDGDN
ncbi:hypothetical protein [Roseovarius nanhaiticus]|uniref:hypothetical protein n=1 Tax=Roseovarius nanhaiticus TaxID=573024 RepID=UPI00248F4AA7|nr:hypothetical protein [Roseovarius nanhaiticus]